MYKLQSINEHATDQDVKDLYDNRHICVTSIVETLNNQVSYEDVDQMMVSELFGLGKLMKGIFVNPFVKRKIRKLTDKLVDVRVEIAKLSLETDLNDFEDEFDEDEFEDYDNPRNRNKRGRKSSRGGGDKEDAAIDAKKSAFEDQADALEAKMDLLANGDERLEKYVTLQKIETRLKANELIIKMADNSQKKVLKKYNKSIGDEAKSLADDLMEHYALYPTESAQGTQTNEDFKPPERLASRDKIRDLQNKAEELIDKARELEEKGEDTKADIARLGAIAAKKKAGLETINQRIKNLKKKL